MALLVALRGLLVQTLSRGFESSRMYRCSTPTPGNWGIRSDVFSMSTLYPSILWMCADSVRAILQDLRDLLALVAVLRRVFAASASCIAGSRLASSTTQMLQGLGPSLRYLHREAYVGGIARIGKDAGKFRHTVPLYDFIHPAQYSSKEPEVAFASWLDSLLSDRPF